MKSSPESIARSLFASVGFSLTSTVVVFVVLELVLWGVGSLSSWIHPDPLRPEASPAYAGAAWVDEFYREQDPVESRFVYSPFRVSGLVPWQGQYIHNDEHPVGIWRRTTNPDSSHCREDAVTRIWIFGGSTVYGSGVPDWYTIPSFLSRDMNPRDVNRDAGNCVVVTNYGVQGYVATQDLILLVEQLKRGGRPNIVIFYGGSNDAETGMRAADPWSTYSGIGVIKPRAEGAMRGRFDFVRRFYIVRTLDAIRQYLLRGNGTSSEPQLRAKAALVLDNYTANLTVARALGLAYKFKLFAFWEPMLLYGHKPLVGFEQQINHVDATSETRVATKSFIAAYQEAERRAPREGFVSLAGVFDSVPDAVYLDEVHLGPRGNEVVANAIAKYLQDHPAAGR